MKRIICVFLMNFCLLSFLYSQSGDDGGEGGEPVESDGEVNAVTDAESGLPEDTEGEPLEDTEEKKPFQWPSWMTSEGATLSTGKQSSRQFFELGILDITMSMAGLFDLLDNGFNPEKMTSFSGSTDIFMNPLYARFPVGNIFDLDVFTGADIAVNVNMPGKTIEKLKGIMDKADNPSELQRYINELGTINDGMSAASSVFLEIGAGGSKTLMDGRLWVRAAPSLYFTVLHMKRGGFSLEGDNEGTKYGLEGSGYLHMYSAWDLKQTNENMGLFNSPGIDFTLEALYALWPVFDAGVSVSHIPLIPSTLKHRMSLDASKISLYVDTNDPGSMKFDMPENLEDMMTNGDNENEIVLRPVRFDFHGFIKPFRSPVLLICPNIGATVNAAASPALFNWGLNIHYNAPVIFSAFVGTGLTEGVWEQRFGLSFDFRVFELDLGAGLAGASFSESWSGDGLSAMVGLKFGF
jgi:hypothetical protein